MHRTCWPLACSLGFRLIGRECSSLPAVYSGCCSIAPYCDPLWTMVSGLAWIVPFGVVAFSPLRGDTNSFDALFLGWVAVLLLNAALEYVYSLSQYRARIQFPDLLQRPRLPVFASAIFQSKFAKYFYWASVPGWRLEFGCCTVGYELSSWPQRSRPFYYPSTPPPTCTWRAIGGCLCPLHRACSLRSVLVGGNRAATGVGWKRWLRTFPDGCMRQTGGERARR
jgi:hypothetical protein